MSIYTDLLQPSVALPSTPPDLCGHEDLLVYYGLHRHYKRLVGELRSGFEEKVFHLPGPSPFFTPVNEPPIPQHETHLMPLLNTQYSNAPIKIQHNPQLQSILSHFLRNSSGKNRTETIDRLKSERSTIINAEIEKSQSMKQKKRQEVAAAKKRKAEETLQPLTLTLKRHKSETIVDI